MMGVVSLFLKIQIITSVTQICSQKKSDTDEYAFLFDFEYQETSMLFLIS